MTSSNRKHGRSDAPVDYLHPSLEPILKPTYGVILYQEQVMQIAQVLAGYTLGGADLLRKAMGKKKPEEMAQQRSVFVSGAVARGVREYTAGHIFDLMEKFAGYGFNKSHSAAYALLSYQTAYLKAHYPAQFMAAVLSADMDHTDKVVTLIKECSDMGLAVLPPDVNASRYEFAACGERQHPLRPGRGARRGPRRGGGDHRRARGARPVPLARGPVPPAGPAEGQSPRAGGADPLGQPRRPGRQPRDAHGWSGAAPCSSAIRTRARNQAGQNDLFGLAADGRDAALERQRAAPLPDWSEAVRLQGERETLGLYLTGHPHGALRGGLAALRLRTASAT